MNWWQPPIVYVCIVIIFLLSIPAYRYRKLIFTELKRWVPEEINLGLIKIKRHNPSESVSPGKTGTITSVITSTIPLNRVPDKTYSRFIGRESEVQSILSSLRDPISQKMIVIVGMGGIGKSALAREIIERVMPENKYTAFWWTTAKQHSFDFRDETSSDVLVTYEILLNRLISWLGLGSQVREDSSLEDRETSIHKALMTSSFLLILDNLETALDQERIVRRLAQLLKGTLCQALLTTREGWANSQLYCDVYSLAGLNDAESIQLIRDTAISNKRVLKAKDTTLRKIAHAVGGSPLALKLLVGLLEIHDANSLLDAIKKIQLDPLRDLYDYLFINVWRSLNESEKELLVAISTFDEEDGVSAFHLSQADVVKQDDFPNIIGHLVQMSLVEVSGTVESMRYRMHPLTYNFIRSKCIRPI